MKRWPTRPLGELCDVRIGRTPRRDEPRFWGGDAVWVTIRELNGGEIMSSKETVSDAAVRECMPEPVPPGTLLFSFKLSIGKMAVAGCPLYTNEAIAALPIRKPTELSRDFLRYALLRESHEGTANTAVMGKVLNKEKVQNLSIPVPPLTEQERIVKLLDEADELRKLRAQADRRTAALIPALFHEMFGVPATNPKGFSKKPLGDLIRVKSGDSLPAKDMDAGGKFPVYGGNGVSGYHGKFMFEQQVVVIGRVGVYCGAVHLSEPKSWVTDNALYVCELKKDFELLYLVAALRLANFNQYAGRAAQPLVSGSRIYPVPILVPPLTLQKEFAQRVTEIREIEAGQATSRLRLNALFASVLDRAFKGEL